MKKLLACVVFAAACGGGAKTAPTTTTANTADQVAGAKLTITSLKFYQSEKLGLQLAADGTLSALAEDNEWKAIGKLGADGTFTVGGKVVATLGADGTVTIPGSKDSFKLDGAAIIDGDKRITIDDKGMFVGGNKDMPPLRVEGAVDDGAKRAALFMIGVISIPGQVKAKVE